MKKRKFDQVYEFADPIAEEVVPYYKTAKVVYNTAKNIKELLEPDTINAPTNQNYPPMKKNSRMIRKRPRRIYKPRGVSGRLSTYARTQYKGSEIKAVDLIPVGGQYQTLTQVISTTTAIFGLNIPRSGTTDYNRIGNRVKGHSIHLQGYIYNQRSSTAGAGDDLARFVLVYDKFPNGTAPVWSDIYKGVDAGGNTNTVSTALPRNDQTLDRFIILRDEQVVLQAVATDGDNSLKATVVHRPEDRMINWYVPLKGLITEYIANTGAQSDLGTGGIFLLYKSWITSSADSAWVFTGTSRYQFYDN